MRLLRRTLPALLAAAWACGAARAAESPALDARVAYERSLEAKAESLLEQVLGPRRARVFVQAELDLSVTEEALPKGAKAAELPEVLPGYRPQGSMKRIAPAKDPVRRLAVTVVLDPSVEETMTQAVINTCTEVLALDPSRGDELRVARAPLRPSLAKELERPAVTGTLAVLAGAALIFILALPFVLRLGKRQFLSAWREMRSEEAPLTQAVRVLEGELPVPAELEWVGSPKPMDLHFLTPQHYKAAARFLASQSPAAVRWALSSLDAEGGAAVFRLLPEAVQRSAASEMLRDRKPDMRACEKLELALREFLAKEASGPALLENLLVRSTDRTRQEVLDHLTKESPAAAGRVQSGLMSFHDLARADPGSLTTLASESTIEEIALALQGAAPSLQDLLLCALPRAMRDGARGKLERLVPHSREEVERARASLISRWRELEGAGRVTPL